MKKVLGLLVCASFALVTYVSAAKVDLQPRNVFLVTAADQIISNLDAGLYVNVQNNGPEDFQGAFMITYDGGFPSSVDSIRCSITINSGEFKPIRLSSSENVASITLDSKNEVSETNKVNNKFYLGVDDTQVRIISSWNGLIAQDYYPTLFVLPNEYFYQQFSLSELSVKRQKNNQKSIIGFDFDSYAYDFSREQSYYSSVQAFWPDSAYQDYNLQGGKYYFKTSTSENYNSSCQWMANASANAINYFWLNSFQGEARGMAVGSEAKVYLNVKIALSGLGLSYDNLFKTIKVIDRIRGDVNDDGVVDQTDLDILRDVLDNGLYNPCLSLKNMYSERGMNYGAGIVIFTMPDFISNCLINIWLNDKNDPLVQGLGIGELMSKTAPGLSTTPVYGVKNSFSISGEDLSINAPGANLYNVTAQKADGKLFQVTGKIGEQIKLPIGVKNVRVETVKVKQSLTNLTSPKNNLSVSVYPTKVLDYVNVKYSGNGKVQVVGLTGQIIFSSPLKSSEELRIETSSWANGVYVINVISEAGTKSTKIIK
ncbi:MAG: T9SS type A sorting domain-containing protein [Patescibacteria group bacterium]